MGRRADADRDVRSITKLGSKSFAVTIPIDYVRNLGWKEKDEVEVKVNRGRIVISKKAN